MRLPIDKNSGDGFIINSLMMIIRKLLRVNTITSQQIVGLGTALYALERLPETTDVSVQCELSISNRQNDTNIFITVWYFSISASSLYVNSDGIEQNKYGSDSYHRFSWGVEKSGYQGFPDCDFDEWLNEVNGLFADEFELTVTNNSVFVPLN